LIIPAVKGTLSILQSALKYGTSVKRIVITSSVAAVLHVASEAMVFSEKDWNEQAVEMVRELGKGATPQAKYRASKTLAEKAAWDFAEKNKSQIGWDIVALNPPNVFGPALHEVSSPSALNQSLFDWYDVVLTPSRQGKDVSALATTGGAWVDVRDLADAHLLALEKNEAGGERFIICKGKFVWQEFVDAAKSVNPKVISTLANPDVLKAEDDMSAKPVKAYMVDFDNSKGMEILGISYKTERDCATDMIADFGKRGW